MPEPFDPDLERQILEEAEAVRAAQEVARADYTPERVAELERVAQDYPWLPADAADAVVSSGLTAGDEATRLVAGAALAEGQEIGTIGQRALTQDGQRALQSRFAGASGASAGDEGGVGSFGVSATAQGRRVGASLSDRLGQALNVGTETLGVAAQVAGVREGDFAYEQVVKPATRTLMTAADAPVQMTHGYVSSLHDSIVEEGWIRGLTSSSAMEVGLDAIAQTDLGAATLETIETGSIPDMGTGFFVGEETQVGQRRMTERMRFETIGGQPFTVGALVADQVSEPGTRPFQVMSGLTNLSLEVAGPGAAFDHIFLANKARKTIDATNAEAFLTSDRGVGVIDNLTESSSFNHVDRALGGNADPRVVEAIRQSNDPSEVADLVRSQAGIEMTQQPSIPRFEPVRNTVRDQLPATHRALGLVPENMLSITDTRQRVDNARNYLRNANASSAEVDHFASRMAAAETPTDIRLATQEMLEVTAWRAFRDTLPKDDPLRQVANADNLGELLQEAPEEIRAISRAFSREMEESRAFWVQALEDGGMSHQHMDYWEEGLPTSQAYAELLSNSIPLPSAREVREIFASPMFKAYQKIPGAKAAHHATDLLTENLMNVWKAGRLLRIAWPLKILPEGQLRLAMFGFSSIINHPLDYLAYATRRGGRGRTDAMFNPLEASDKMRDAMFVTSDVTRIGPAQQQLYADSWRVYRNPAFSTDTATKGDEFAKHYADTFNRLSSSGEFQMVLRSSTFDEASETFWENMAGTRQSLQAGRPSDARDVVANRLDADDYLRQNVYARIDEMTGGDPDLLEAFRTRTLDGHPIIKDGRTTINPAFVKALEKRLDRLPQVINGRDTISVSRNVAKNNGVVNRLFSGLMSTPSNKLDRSPLFRQTYWRAIERVAIQIDPAEAVDLLRAADAANLSRKQRAAIAQRVSQAPPNANRILTVEEADLIAKSDGLKSVKDVLYDASERMNLFDITRHVFPFGDAFLEVMSRWIKIFAENPNRIRKTEATIEAAGGIFSENQYGDETFNMPMSEPLMAAFGVDNLSLRGYQSGLSIATEMWPGYGPVLQVPASSVIPDEPEYEWLRDHLSSGFGLPPDAFEDPAGVLNDTLVPPWVRRAIQAATGRGLTDQDERTFANLVGDIAMNKITDDPNWQIAMDDETMDVLLAESRRDAQVAFALRSAYTFTIPGAPTFEMTTDVTGETLASWVVEAEYRRMADEMGPNEAALAFTEEYGFDALALTAPASRDLTSGGGMPVHRAGVEWVQRNDFAEAAYPETYGFFAPPEDPDDEDSFMYEVYAQRFTDGESQHLSPEMRIGLMQDYIARLRYGIARDEVLEADGGSISQAGQEYLRGVRDQLEELYPGHEGIPGLGEKVSPEAQIGQLIEAVDDPRLADNPLTETLSTYLDRRELVNDNAEGTHFASGHSGDAYNRQHMYEVGTALAADDPQFAEVWERVLYPEFRGEHEADLEGEG